MYNRLVISAPDLLTQKRLMSGLELLIVGVLCFQSLAWPRRECVPAELMYYVPPDNQAILCYSTDYGMFHFCIADSEHDWREGSEQCAWIEKCLISVDRQKQPWLIFSANRVLGYSSKSWLTSESVIGVVVAINDIVLFQGGAVKEVRSIVIDDPE
ncbi:nucleotide pyrophosphatase/phosphodiesterase-like protein [Tanacetum coccineum]